MQFYLFVTRIHCFVLNLKSPNSCSSIYAPPPPPHTYLFSISYLIIRIVILFLTWYKRYSFVTASFPPSKGGLFADGHNYNIIVYILYHTYHEKKMVFTLQFYTRGSSFIYVPVHVHEFGKNRWKNLRSQDWGV